MARIKYQEEIYEKNGVFILKDTENRFVYQTHVYLYHKNYFSLIKNVYYSSSIEIKGVVGSFFKNKHIQIVSELYSAPEFWIKENDFKLYVPPEKIKRIKKINK